MRRLVLLTSALGVLVWGMPALVARVVADQRRRPLDRALCNAAKWGDVLEVKRQLALGASVHGTCRLGTGGRKSRPRTLTPLGWAVFYDQDVFAGGRPEIVRLLLDRGADPNRMGDSWLTPLDRTRNPATARLLVARGGRVSADALAVRRLLNGALQGETAGVETELARGVPVDSVDGSGRTALCLAAWMGHSGTVRLLLARGARPDVTCNAGVSAREYAAQSGDPATMRLLSRGS